MDAIVVLGIKQGQSYKLLKQPAQTTCISRGSRTMDTILVSVAEREQVTRKSDSSSAGALVGMI